MDQRNTGRTSGKSDLLGEGTHLERGRFDVPVEPPAPVPKPPKYKPVTTDEWMNMFKVREEQQRPRRPLPRATKH